jgi:hypothetical protein
MELKFQRDLEYLLRLVRNYLYFIWLIERGIMLMSAI